MLSGENSFFSTNFIEGLRKECQFLLCSKKKENVDVTNVECPTVEGSKRDDSSSLEIRFLGSLY